MGAISDAGPLAWWKFDGLSGLVDGDPISSVSDASGNGNAATGSGAARPTYKTVSPVPAGLGAAQFDGSNDILTASAQAHDTSGTVFAVVYLANAAGNKGIIGSSANGGFYWNVTTNNIPFGHRTGGVELFSSDTAISAGAWHVLALKYTTSTMEHRIDGAKFQFGSVPTGYTGTGTTTIGAYAAGVEHFNGYLGELVRYTGALTDAQVVAIELELAAKWGVDVISGESVSATLSASSVLAGAPGINQPSKLVDGLRGSSDQNAFAAASAPPQWVQQDLGSPVAIGSYLIAPRADAPAYAPAAWTLDGSNDLSTWTTLDTRSGQSFVARDTKRYKFSNSTAYRYYRLNISATGNGQLPTFSEWELYKVSAPAATTGAVSASASAAAVSVAGTVTTLGSVAAAAPSPAVAVAGAVVRTGSVAASAPSPALAVTGDIPAVTPGAVAATASAPSVVIAGTVAGITSGIVTAVASSPTLGVAGVLPTAGVVAATAAAPAVSVDGDVTGPTTGAVSATAPSPSLSIGDGVDVAEMRVGVTVEVGALTLLNLVTLPGAEVAVGLGAITAGDSQPVVPLPGVSIAVGASLDARPVDLIAADPRHKRAQWRYVVTDLANTPLGELTDIQHDPVADGVNTPTTMRFVMSADDPMRALIEAGDPLTRKCQVWSGNQLLLWGPILPDQQSDALTAGYTVHDPSWWWRGGRRVIGRLPRKNLLRNGDFRQGLTFWERGFDADSIPKAKPAVRVVTEDFLNDTDGLDPIRAAEITGVESVTQAELSSNAVFWPNLATFRPGGKAAIEAVANAMPTTTGLKVSVVGHTANDGTGNGLGLSARRAEAAKAVILTKRPHAVITTKGVGFYDPKPGFPVDSQEQRRVVISYDQTISGKSKQWMRQTIEVTQPKSARYGLELTAAAMLKVADDWSVEDANMMSVRLVARRKSTPKKIWDESSASISDTDPVGRWIGQSTSVTIPADDRAYLVDVYLYAPAALADYTAVGLFPEEELFFWGQDQALIFKGIVEHIQDPAMGHGDLGIETRTPLTGIKRDRTYPFREHMPADTALEEFGGLNRGMDYDTLMTTDGRVILSTFYPQQGKHSAYVLHLGGNVANATPERSRDVASSIIMQAQDLGSYRAETYAKDSRALGGLLLEKVVTAEQGTPLNELTEAARQELAWGRVSTTGYWLDIDPDFIADVLANTGKGDTVRLILDAPVPVDRLARIVNRERHPDSLRLLVALD